MTLDMESLSYYGVSWGGYMANILLAIDDRVTTAVVECRRPVFPTCRSKRGSVHLHPA